MVWMRRYENRWKQSKKWIPKSVHSITNDDSDASKQKVSNPKRLSNKYHACMQKLWFYCSWLFRALLLYQFEQIFLTFDNSGQFEIVFVSLEFSVFQTVLHGNQSAWSCKREPAHITAKNLHIVSQCLRVLKPSEFPRKNWINWELARVYQIQIDLQRITRKMKTTSIYSFVIWNQEMDRSCRQLHPCDGRAKKQN